MGNEMAEKYPECQKLMELDTRVKAVLGFMTFLEDEGVADIEWTSSESVQDAIYRYFELDAKKIEAERRAMLESLKAG